MSNHRVRIAVDGCCRLVLCSDHRGVVAVVAARLERLVAGGCSSTAKIRRAKVVVTAILAVERLPDSVIRRIGESRVDVEDAAHSPFAENLFKPSIFAFEDHRFPDRKHLQGFSELKSNLPYDNPGLSGKYGSSE